MAEEPDVIRHQIEATRGSLTEKLETLEGQVKEAVGTVTETIESVKSGVENTVENVKTSLSDTVDSVKEKLDLSAQVQRRPWGAVGCSLAAGVAAGYLLSGPRRYRRPSYEHGIPGMNQLIPGYEPSRPAEAPRQEYRQEYREASQKPDFLSKLVSSFGDEIDKIKETAVGALLGIARDALKDALPPSLAANVHEIMDRVTRRVGGEPVRGPVLAAEDADAVYAARARSVS
jgi:ElaB/YqjD/DUF883 family membrane-anchored ribosome-binding protein